MNENTARFPPQFFSQALHVHPELPYIGNGGRVLLAFHDDRLVVLINQKDVEPSAIFEDALAKLLV